MAFSYPVVANPVQDFFSALQQGEQVFSRPEQAWQQIRSQQLSNALREAMQPLQIAEAQRQAQIAPLEQQARIQDIQSQIANQPALEEVKLRNMGIFRAPQVTGQPPSLPALPLESGLSEAVAKAVPTPQIQSVIRTPLGQTIPFSVPPTYQPAQAQMEAQFPPKTYEQIAPGTIYAPELSPQFQLEQKKASDLAKTKAQQTLNERLAEITAKQKGAENIENLRQTGREKLESQRQVGRLELAQKKAQAASAFAGANEQAVEGAINLFENTGQIPSLGLGMNPLKVAFLAHFGSETADGSDLINTAMANKAVRSGLTKTIATQENQLGANKTALRTIDAQMELAKPLMKKVAGGIPFINKYNLWLKGQIQGDPDTAAAQQIIKTMSNEFAKVMSGAAASIAGTTVSSAADAEKILNTALTNGQFLKVADIMRKEADARLSSQQNTLNDLQNDLRNIGKPVQSGQTEQSKATIGTTPSENNWIVTPSRK